MPISHRLDKENVAHIHHEILCSHRKESKIMLFAAGGHYPKQTNAKIEKQIPRTIQDGPSLTSRDCSSQGGRGELEDATLSDKFWSLMEQKIPQWRKHTGRQRHSRGWRSSSAGTSAWQLSEQSKQVRRTCTGPQQDTRARRSGCDSTSVRQHSAQS